MICSLLVHLLGVYSDFTARQKGPGCPTVFYPLMLPFCVYLSKYTPEWCLLFIVIRAGISSRYQRRGELMLVDRAVLWGYVNAHYSWSLASRNALLSNGSLKALQCTANVVILESRNRVQRQMKERRT